MLIPTHTLFLLKKGKENKNIFWPLIQLNYVIQFSTLKHLKTNKIISTGSLDFVFFSVQLVLRERTCKLLARFYQRTAMLSILLAKQSDLLRLTLTSTVAKHSAGSTTADVLIVVFCGVWPITVDSKHLCGLKVAERPQTVFPKSHACLISTDITSWWGTGVAVVTLLV